MRLFAVRQSPRTGLSTGSSFHFLSTRFPDAPRFSDQRRASRLLTLTLTCTLVNDGDGKPLWSNAPQKPEVVRFSVLRLN